uniref:Uncharacterized protein n=1 Tax=Avena sativa TaxID=4498 RepID=A0ACD5ZHY6_AVESA
MAELAVGLSRSVVAGAITKVESAIEQDARLHQKVKRDLEFISLEFEMMRSFMDDGAKQEMKSNLVRTWVKQIRQLAYDVEDCVENVVQLDDKPIFWRRFLPIGMCMEAPLPLDEAAEELEQLKGRVEDINNCYRRYNLINESSTPEGSSRTLAVIQQPPPATRASDLLAEARYAARCCWKQSISGDLILTQFIRRHKKDLGLGVICVWGSGGDEGTTSIIRETYDDTRICQDFTYRSWVKIVHPFSRHQFIQALMAQFYAAAAAASSCKQPRRATILRKMEAATTTHQDLLDEFHKIVTQETYLVVLEGLSNIVDWDAIRAFLPDMMNGSRIIVSTQLPEIACLCVGRHSYRIVELERFSTEHSVCALFKLAKT